MKTCTQCKQMLPRESFYAAKHHKDGLESSCKSCHAARIRIQRGVGKRAAATAYKYELVRRHGKHCSICGEFKQAKEFYPKKRMADKLTTECRTCNYKRTVRYRNTENGRALTRLNNRRHKENYKLLHPKEYHEKYVLYAHNYRARQRQATPDFRKADWVALLEQYHHACAYCGDGKVKLTMDHVVALDNGGSHTKDNIVPACGPCNFRKHTKELSLFAIQR